MKIKSGLVTQASGSLGGFTASHNRGGLYLRARATPVNPNSPQQQEIRGFFAQLASLWLNVLTGVQREAWDLYALNVLLPDRLGEARNVGGLAMYIRSNVPRLQAALPRVDDAPTIFNLGDYFPPSIGDPSEATQLIVVAFAALDEWVNEDDAAMLIYTARAQNQSINYFKGPYRLAGTILGDLALPPTSPADIPAAFPFEIDHKVFVRINVTRVDGRLGSEFFLGRIAIA